MAPQAPRAVRAQNLYLETKQKIEETPLGAGGAPISISPVLSNLQRRYILGRIQSDLRSPSSISNLHRRHLRPDSVRSPISISNLQSVCARALFELGCPIVLFAAYVTSLHTRTHLHTQPSCTQPINPLPSLLSSSLRASSSLACGESGIVHGAECIAVLNGVA